MTNNESAEFERLARPLMKWLAENYHPHVEATITATTAQLTEGLLSLGKIFDYVKD